MADGTKRQVSLNHAAKMQWPTPTQADGMGGPGNSGRGGGLNLRTQVQGSAKPTPTTQDAHNTGSQSQQARNTPPLNAAVLTDEETWPTPTANRWDGLQSHGRNVVSGSLNPAFVEMLMGFPVGWTDVD
jgi:hypothetical protein